MAKPSPPTQTPAAEPKSIKGNYNWAAMKVPLNMDNAKRMGLVVGVLATEGKSHNGDIVDNEHILQGTGGLHAVAMKGQAYCYIDHKDNGVDESYEKDYGRELVEQSNPAGMIIDCAAIKEDDKYKTEFLAMTKPAVYAAIGEGKVNGNSVHDLPRARDCKGESCKSYTSSYMHNSFMVKQVASMDGTYVRQATEEDLKNINSEGVSYAEEPAIATHIEKWNVPVETPPAPPPMPAPPATAAATTPVEHGTEKKLDNYRNTSGGWLADDSASKYLTDVKMLPAAIATEIVAYMKENPDAISMRQLEHYTTDHFFQFWNATKVHYMEQRLAGVETKIKEQESSDPLAGVGVGTAGSGTAADGGSVITPDLRAELVRKQEINYATAMAMQIPPGTTKSAITRIKAERTAYLQRAQDIDEFLKTH